MPIPALIGTARLTQRVAEPGGGKDALDLMTAAVEAAIDDAGTTGDCIDLIAIPRGTWPVRNPGAVIAERIGARNARTVVAEIGVLQHSLIKRVCDAIAAGEIRSAIVCGAETKYRSIVAAKGGVEALEDLGPESEPDETMSPAEPLVTRFDFERGIVQAPVQYSLIESAYAHDAGLTPDQMRAELGALWADFAAVAASDELAWDRSAPSPEQIVTAAEDNRMVSAPYTKLLCSQWNVDQAAALVFSGDATDRALYPIACTESNAMIAMLQREEIHRWAGFQLAAKRALDLVGRSIDDIDLLELYSCFPAAVRVQKRELAITDDRGVNVSGGMTFGGGPLNNFVLQSTARMAECLHEGRGATGIVTGISGLLTKPGITIWSTDADGYASDDLTRETLKGTPALPFAPDATGPATIVGHTVSYDRFGSARALAIVQFDDYARSAAGSSRDDDIDIFLTTDAVGRRVEVGPADTFEVR